jgi:carbon-monoxide dehydrogenase small subunit
VLVDGVAVDSCLVPAAHAEGTAVTTIEGAGRTRQGRSLQDSFEACGAAQCGICTPGMIIAALSVRPAATTDAITGALAGNLCRCTGYTSIIRAVQQATRAPRSRRSSRSSRTRAHGRAS